MPNIGDLAVGGIRPIVSVALEAQHQMALGSGVLYNLTVLNYGAAANLVLLLDQTASPAGYSGTAVTPIWAYPIAASAAGGPGLLTVGGAFLTPPIAFRNGLWVMLSSGLTTPFSATSGTASGYFSALVQQG